MPNSWFCTGLWAKWNPRRAVVMCCTLHMFFLMIVNVIYIFSVSEHCSFSRNFTVLQLFANNAEWDCRTRSVLNICHKPVIADENSKITNLQIRHSWGFSLFWSHSFTPKYQTNYMNSTFLRREKTTSRVYLSLGRWVLGKIEGMTLKHLKFLKIWWFWKFRTCVLQR